MPTYTKKSKPDTTTVFLFNPAEKTYQKTELSGVVIALRHAQKYRWLLVVNPYPIPGRSFLIIEKGTGYILAYGNTEEDALSNARRRFKGESLESIQQSDIGQLLKYQQQLLERFVGEEAASVIKPFIIEEKIIPPPPPRMLRA